MDQNDLFKVFDLSVRLKHHQSSVYPARVVVGLELTGSDLTHHRSDLPGQSWSLIT